MHILSKLGLTFATLAFSFSQLIGAPQVVVFDFNGVLTSSSNWQSVIAFLQDTFGLPGDEFERKVRQAFILGKTEANYWIAYAKTRGIALPSDWSDSYMLMVRNAIGINPDMFKLVEELKNSHVQVALFSNTGKPFAELIHSFGYYELFDPCLFSYKIGVKKPDLRAYAALLETLNLPASDVIFIDDKPENVAAAILLGIDAILFQSAEQLRQELLMRNLFA